MPHSVPAHEVYRTLMADAKIRILAAEAILSAKRPRTGLKALDMEFVYLQVRRVIENITFGGLVREEARYAALRGIEKTTNARDHGDPSRDWQAPEILKRLVGLSPHALPIPHKEGKELSPGLVHYDRQDIEVNHARLIDLYKHSGGFLHAMNPIGSNFAADINSQRKRYAAASRELRRTLEFLRKLLWQHAAIALDQLGNEDPRTPANPQTAWLVNFGTSQGPEVALIQATAE
jgi:hypothetical protein